MKEQDLNIPEMSGAKKEYFRSSSIWDNDTFNQLCKADS